MRIFKEVELVGNHWWYGLTRYSKQLIPAFIMPEEKQRVKNSGNHVQDMTQSWGKNKRGGWYPCIVHIISPQFSGFWWDILKSILNGCSIFYWFNLSSQKYDSTIVPQVYNNKIQFQKYIIQVSYKRKLSSGANWEHQPDTNDFQNAISNSSCKDCSDTNFYIWETALFCKSTVICHFMQVLTFPNQMCILPAHS